MNTLRVLAFSLGIFLLPASAFAAPVPARISVLTMGPGSEAFARFGHNALLVELGEDQPQLVYNFGTFAFDGLQGVEDFMAGRFRYWLSVSRLGRTADFYAAHNRSLVAQELALSPAERGQLFEALQKNALPANKYYDYDYYRDNCSTRVRDAVDHVLGGHLRRSIQGPGRLSFRAHTTRLTAGDLWLSLGLDLALGPLTDRPTTRWEETFIPSELHDALASTTRALDGKQVPLVRAERVYLTADREPLLKEPPSRVPAFLAVGVALGLLLAACGRAAAKVPAARVAFGLLAAMIGLVLGLLGTVFCVFWFFTKHWSAYRNVNILVCPPWALGLLVLGVALALAKPWAVSKTQRLLLVCAIGSGVGVLLALIPNFGQDNTRIAALLAPIWFGLCAGGVALGQRTPAPAVSQSSASGT